MGPKYVSRPPESIDIIDFFRFNRALKNFAETPPSKSTQPERKEIETWFEWHSTRLL